MRDVLLAALAAWRRDRACSARVHAPAESQRSRNLTLLAAIAIAVSGAIGFYHAGVELGIFGRAHDLHINRQRSDDGSAEEIMNAPLVRCDQVQFAFLGISMAGWNAILSLGGAAAITWLT